VTSVTFSASGDLLYTGGRDRVINVWNVASRYAHVRTLPVYEQVESMTRLPTGYVQFAGIAILLRPAPSRVDVLERGWLMIG